MGLETTFECQNHYIKASKTTFLCKLGKFSKNTYSLLCFSVIKCYWDGKEEKETGNWCCFPQFKHYIKELYKGWSCQFPFFKWLVFMYMGCLLLLLLVVFDFIIISGEMKQISLSTIQNYLRNKMFWLCNVLCRSIHSTPSK